MKKRVISMVLALVMVIGLLPALATEAEAAGLSLNELQAKFPTGTYWNHYVSSYEETGDRLVATRNESFADNITNTPCASHNTSYTVGSYDCNYFDGGVQCCGFARKLAYDAFGSRATTWPTASSVKPGDVVWFKSAVTDATYGHWVFVYAVSGSYITVGEASVEGNLCMIRWGHTYDMASFYSYTIYAAPYTLATSGSALDVGDDFYARIKNPARNMYVSNDNNNVSLRSKAEGVSQIWFFDRLDDGSYRIRSPLNGKVLDVGDASAAAGANVQTWEQNGSSAQKWYITGEAGDYQLSAQCTACVLDISGGGSAEGTNIQMYTRNSSNAQSFDVEILSDLSPLPQVTSGKRFYAPGEQVTLTWPYVCCTDRFWIDIWTADGEHPVSENLRHGTSYTFTPAATGEYLVYVTATMVDTNYLSEPYRFTVTSKPLAFTDVPAGSFYADPVAWAVERGITNGTSATRFSPDGSCLRAHVVTFLHRAEGNPEPTTARNPFSDVKSGDFFYKPVLWAVEKGITNGISATRFGSNDVCNRAAVVTFLWRASGCPEPQSTRNPFKDVKATDFFYKPVLWAVENGITNGVDATHFGPDSPCNRAQVVTFLYRAYN